MKRIPSEWIPFLVLDFLFAVAAVVLVIAKKG
jgi:hypothetical protein